jgi:hypothetical protein
MSFSEPWDWNDHDLRIDIDDPPPTVWPIGGRVVAVRRLAPRPRRRDRTGHERVARSVRSPGRYPVATVSHNCGTAARAALVPGCPSGQCVAMGFHLTDRLGEMHADASVALIDSVLAELDGPDDPEHPDVALSHESGWTLSAFTTGLLVWENVEDGDDPRHLPSVDRSEVRTLWAALAEGDLAKVEAQPWQSGYGA